MFKQFLVVLPDPVLVVQDVLGLLHQLAVGVTHTQPQPRHPVQQGTKLARLLKLRKRFVDNLLPKLDLENNLNHLVKRVDTKVMFTWTLRLFAISTL